MPKIGFKDSNGVDIGDKLVPKSYLIEVYPELLDNFRFAGLWLWGWNPYGQLGINNTSGQSSPVQTIAGGTNWKLVAGGSSHTVAIKTDGTLWTWGYNNIGQLGTNDQSNRSSPVQTIVGGTNWKSIACGEYHTAAIKTDGTLWTWGWNIYGQLGTNHIFHQSSPVQTISGGANWKSVACGQSHTVAIKTDGTLWTWGRNNFGQLGTNDTTDRSSPVQTIASGTNWKLVASGYYHTVAIKTDGTLWTWGRNNFGQLGTNDNTNQSSPVQTISGGANWKSVACGQSHTVAIKTDGTLWTWGDNFNGQLGTNDTTRQSSPVQTIAGGTNWKSVTCGYFHTVAIKTDGTLWTWGRNDYGQLGTNDRTDRSSPVQTIAGGTNWKLVACGSSHTSAIRDDSEDLL